MRASVLLSATLAVLIGWAGCAIPPPQMEGNRYLNPAFGFSAGRLAGWIPYDELSAIRRQQIDALIKTEGRLVLADASSGGIIVASGYRTNDDWSDLKLDRYRDAPDLLKEQIATSISQTIEKEINPDHYSLDVSPSGFQKTNRNWQNSKAAFVPAFIAGFTDPLKQPSTVTGAYTQIASYPCHGGRICALWVTLLFEESEFGENMKALREFKSSIRAHDKGLL